MKILIAFLVGLVIGVPFGFILCAMLTANDNGKRGDE